MLVYDFPTMLQFHHLSQPICSIPMWCFPKSLFFVEFIYNFMSPLDMQPKILLALKLGNAPISKSNQIMVLVALVNPYQDIWLSELYSIRWS